MISDETKSQLAKLKVEPDRPLLICDVDEVIVHFTSDLENYIAAHGLWLQPSSLALAGNIRRTSDNLAISTEHVSDLIDDFFAKRTRHMQPIVGAVEALQHISRQASIVLLTNLPHFAGDDRRANLSDLGISFPVITNSGPKGPAINELASRTQSTVAFVDDSPGFIQSAYDHAPHIHLVHFLQDERFAAHQPPFDFVSLRTGQWLDAKPHILELFS
jgi:FMN phosphatase YigB (HAD superfamily)